MGMLDEMAEDSLAKLLLIADSKAGKTHWAMQAAELGFNVLYVDGDVGRQTLSKLSPAAKKRVAYMGVGDFVDEKGVYQYRMALMFREFTTTGVFTWNDTLGELFDRKTYEQEFANADAPDSPTGGHDVWQIRPAKMDHRDIIIFDSWTSYVQSISAWKAADLGVDLSDIEKAERSHYAGISNKATQALVMIQHAPCHFIVIAHPDEYQKKKSPVGTVGSITETQMIIEWTKMVAKSTSRPHSLTMPKFFSDVAWIDVSPTGKRKIDMKAAQGRSIGGHFDDSEEVEKRTFGDLVLKIGGSIPTGGSDMSRWLTRYPNGSFVPAGSKPAILGVKPSAAAVKQDPDTSEPTTASATPARGLGGLTGLKFKGIAKP